MKGVGVRMAGLLTVRDPGHARLVTATSITLGVLLSVAMAWAIVHTLHADMGLLSVAVFLSMQAGNMVKDATPKLRLHTTLILAPTVVAVIGLVALLSHLRPLAMLGFVLTVGVAVGARAYGPRASALGGIAFMGYFFGLFMLPHAGNIWVFLLIAVCAVFSQVVIRAVLLVRRPNRELQLLLNELRAGSLAVVHAAAKVDRPEDVRLLLAHTDDVGRAVTQWQRRYDADSCIHIGADELEARVLDARVDTEEAGFALLRARTSHTFGAGESTALGHLDAVLSPRARPANIARAVAWAQRITASANTADTHLAERTPAAYLLARAVITHARLREIDPSRREHRERPDVPPSAMTQRSTTARATHARANTPTPHQSPFLRWREWRTWPITRRMMVQAMIAATVASIVGEAISASRWYWAVMTAFVVFLGASTRGGILTRAYRRIAGTIGGIVLGAAVVFLLPDHTSVLTVAALLAVFGMLYFGPLNYSYMALFITTLLVVVYRMLGILDTQLVELRLVETVTGAVIGVLSAYFILSTSSRPAVSAQVTAYFDALGALLQKARGALGSGGDARGAITALYTLESVQADVDHTMSGLSTALITGASRRDTEAVHMMYVATRAAARLVQSVRQLSSADHTSAPLTGSDKSSLATVEVIAAIATVESTSASAQAALLGHDAAATTPIADSSVLARLSADSIIPGSSEEAAIKALARMSWALRRASVDQASVVDAASPSSSSR